jgi:hypothetical protein
MSIESLILAENISLTDSSQNPEFAYTDKNQGAGYHRRSDNLHTAVYQLDSFSGTIKLQGTLKLYPGEEDWVDIKNSEETFEDSVSQTFTFNFRGNFVWIRAAYKNLEGDIVKIRYNY